MGARPVTSTVGGVQGGPPRVVWAVVAVAALTVPVVGIASAARPAQLDDFPSFTVLLVAAAASAGLRFAPGRERVFFSFTAVVLLAAIPILGPLWATILALGAAVLDARQARWHAWFFNGAMFALATAVASLVYVLAGGRFLSSGRALETVDMTPLSAPVEMTAWFGGPLLAADIAFIATNLSILLLLTPVDPLTPSRLPVLLGALRTVPTYLAWALVAFVIVVLWGPGELSALALLLAIAPLIVARHIHGLFATEQRVRSSIIDALARTGRDDGTEAHGERVARYASAIAGQLGLRQGERSSLQYAARLHAVGMDSHCSPDVRAGGAGTAGVEAALAGHQLIATIPFLRRAALAVLHEAEWVDGTGGPDGLAGGDIPLASRILAVADAADVLARLSEATHPERDAVATLRRWSGTRFDPAVVAAFISALGLHEDGVIVTPPVLDSGPRPAPSRAARTSHATRRGRLGTREVQP